MYLNLPIVQRRAAPLPPDDHLRCDRARTGVYSANERVLEWSISYLSAFPSSLPPFLSRRLRRRFARPPTVWKWKDASACSTLEPGVGRSVCPRTRAACGVCARAQATSMATVPSSPPPSSLSSSSYEATAALLWSKDGPRRRTEPKVGLSDALGERRVGDRERDLVAQGERSHATR